MSAGRACALTRLRDVLREQGGLVASLLLSEGASARASAPARLAARGPRASADRSEYELLMEAIYEGYLLHYGAPRLLDRRLEDDLALLAGDQLYALGLARLVRLGDLPAVSELADVITLCALAHGDSEPELAGAVWEAGARAIGWGARPEHARAKELARAGSPDALTAM
ncbi:MAG: hypothetical protein ACYCYN_14195, partial [Solirubrobacteraceae bacterium]